jgi:hypothetical protein
MRQWMWLTFSLAAYIVCDFSESVNINYRLPIKVHYRMCTLRHIRIEINHRSQNVFFFPHSTLHKYYNLIENQTNVYISIFQQKIVNLVPSIYFSDCLGDLVFTTVAIYEKVMLTFLAHTLSHSHFPYICTSFAMNYGSYSHPRFYAIYFI